MTRKFTGWHMTTIMVAFFAVVVGVNFTMARLAIVSFGGTVVDNSYVASQQYNGWLMKARRQATLGWTPDVTTDATRHVVISIKTAAGLLDGARISATATHPLGALPPVSLTFRQGSGPARSLQRLPAGRWLLHIDVTYARAKAAFDDEIPS
ncbi:MAG: FixH family protein [Sphingomonas sp.]